MLLSSSVMLAALISVLLGAIDLTVVASILPGMIDDLGVNTADVDRYVWAVNAYLISYIVAIPLVGRVSDVFGRRPVMIGSLLIFLAGSVVCAEADSLSDLILGRGIQGFGGGGLLPVAMALAADKLAPRYMLASIGFIGAIETAGWVIGPVYGAALTEVLDLGEAPWRLVFWINVPILVVLILMLAVRSGPRVRRSRSTSSMLDIPGAILLTVSLVSLNLAVSSGGELGARTGTGLRAMGGTENPFADDAPWLLGITVLSTLFLILWEKRASSPFLPVALFRQRFFLASVVANLCLGAVLITVMVNVPLAVALTESTNRVGTMSAVLLAPFTIAVATASLTVHRISKRLGNQRTTDIGITLAVAGCVLIGLLLDQGNLWRMIPGLLATGTGIGLLLPPLGAMPVQLARGSERGAAAASALLFRLLGMTIGISTLTALGVRRLQVLTGQLDPIVRDTDESTASYLFRQREFILDHAIPLSLQVVQETFLAGAFVALLAALPLAMLGRHFRNTRGS